MMSQARAFRPRKAMLVLALMASQLLNAQCLKFSKPCTDLRPIYLLGQAIPNRYHLPRGVALYYDEDWDLHAFKFTQRAKTLRFPSSRVFKYCDIFPEEFSVLITLNVGEEGDKKEEYIFSLIPAKSLDVRLALRIWRGKVIFDYSDRNTPPGKRTSIKFRNTNIFDERWHTIILTVTSGHVTLRTDCGKVVVQRIKRAFPSLLNTNNTNIHIGNSKILADQFTGLLKQLILLPGSDITRLTCPSMTPSTPELSESEIATTRMPPGEPTVTHKELSICSWRETGKTYYDVFSKTLKVCVNGVWQFLYAKVAQKMPVKLDYVSHYQDIHTTSPVIDIELMMIPEEGRFMVMANYDSRIGSEQPSTVYKWVNSSFVPYQNLTTIGAQSWESFTIGNQFFLAVANFGLSIVKEAKSVIYKWHKRQKKFKKHQEIESFTARDIEYFRIENDHYIAIANHAKGDSNIFTSIIYKFDKKQRQFIAYQKIQTVGAYDWTHFVIKGRHFLAIANAFDGETTKVYSKIYIWQEDQFVFFQGMETNGAIDWEFFKVEDDVFLAVANAYNFGPQNFQKIDKYITNSTIYKLNENKNQFEVFQSIPTYSAIDWEFFTVGKDKYLIIANAQDNQSPPEKNKSTLYRWKGMEKFVAIGHLETLPCADWEFFQDGEDMFLVYANAQDNTSQVLKIILQ